MGIAAKFTQHGDLRAELLSTQSKVLVLVDPDTWAGMSAAGGIPKGRNKVGEALMAQRAKCAKEAQAWTDQASARSEQHLAL